MLNSAQLKLRVFSLCGCYIACVAMLYSLGVFCGIFVAPTAANVLHWDGGWYLEIKNYGYLEDNPQGRFASCAFYPLFPLVWRWSGLGNMGILFLNALLFIVSAAALLQCFRADIWKSLLFLATPPLFFCFLPYTEALSFCLLSFFLVFYHNKKYVWAMVFLFLAGLARPLIWQVFPMVMVLMSLDFGRPGSKKSAIPILLLPTAGSSYLVITIYQFVETGVRNANVKAYGYWGGHLQMPTLPLRTFETALSGVWVRQIDYLAFAICLLSLLYLLRFCYKVYVKKRELGSFQLLLAMSCTYLASMMLIRLLTMKGDFWSLGRYIFVNPFFAFFLFFTLRLTLSRFWVFLNVGFLFLSQMLFAKQGHLANWATFGWSDMEFLAISSNLRYLGTAKKYFYALLILLGVFIQCYLLHCYLLNGEWVG